MKRPTIGYFACDVYEEASSSIWEGAAEMAREHDLNLVFYAGGALLDPVEFRSQRNVVYDLVDQTRVDGLVIVSSSIDFSASHEEMLAFLGEFKGLPVVSVEEVFPGVLSVLKDEYEGMTRAIDHLIENHARRRIIFMQGPVGFSGTQERFRAYRDTLAAHNLPFDPNLVTPPTCSWSYDEAVTSFSAYLDQRALQPRFDFDAVAAVNDENAYAAITVLKARGARIPDDIAVTGFDDLAMAGSVAPPLTTVRAPFHSMGRKAVEILLGRMRGEEYSEPFVLPSQLIVRHSCGCLLPTITEAAAAADDQVANNSHEGMGLAAALDEERSAIIAEMAYTVGPGGLAVQGAGQLLNGFIGEIEHGTTGAFLSALDAVLNQVALQGGRVKEWQSAVSAMQRRILPYLLQKKTQDQANNLWHQARVMVGEASWRYQSWKRLRTEDRARELRALSTRLSTAQNLDDLLDILAVELPAFGIPSCYLSLYVDPSQPSESARFVFGYDDRGSIEIAPDQRVFPARMLAPEIVWSGSGRYSLLIEPLYHHTEQLGFVVFETGGMEGGRDGMLWDALQMQISSALMAVQLRQEAENARREAEAGWQLAEERQRAAEEANQLKSRFLSMASHEMRTPLNVITGLSENLIQQRPADNTPALSSVYRDLERISISAQHLDNLIRDVLDLAVSHVRQLKLVIERLEVLEVLNPVLEIGEQMAAEKGLAWRVEVSDALPLISYDRTRLRQVVLNLISNAVKFTEQGEVALCIQATANAVIFSIHDTGLGIPKEEQSLIFEEFHRTERASARGYGGLGLGLAICRRLVELGGGTIGVESSGEAGGGSTFYFSLPSLEENLPVREREQSSLVQEYPTRKILLVDDDLAILDLHARLVEQRLPGCQTRRARNGREALKEMRREKPDLVLLDLMMPEMNGFDLLEVMRKADDLRSIPVVVMTSQKLSEREMEQFNNGVAAVLEKGLFSADEAYAQLSAILGRSKHLGSEARRVARLAMAYIHEHFRDPIARKDLAQCAGVSQEYLSTCFHRETGVTPSDYLERYRIKQAKRLLETTDLSITRVAMEVGFFDSSYFGRVFRREVGISPLAYRRGDRK